MAHCIEKRLNTDLFFLKTTSDKLTYISRIKNIIYRIDFNDRHSIYVGKTTTGLFSRISDHVQKAEITSVSILWAEKYALRQANGTFGKFCLGNDYGDSLLKIEGLFIFDYKTQLAKQNIFLYNKKPHERTQWVKDNKSECDRFREMYNNGSFFKIFKPNHLLKFEQNGIQTGHFK